MWESDDCESSFPPFENVRRKELCRFFERSHLKPPKNRPRIKTAERHSITLEPVYNGYGSCKSTVESRFNDLPRSAPFHSFNRDFSLNQGFLMRNSVLVTIFCTLNRDFILIKSRFVKLRLYCNFKLLNLAVNGYVTIYLDCTVCYLSFKDDIFSSWKISMNKKEAILKHPHINNETVKLLLFSATFIFISVSFHLGFQIIISSVILFHFGGWFLSLKF